MNSNIFIILRRFPDGTETYERVTELQLLRMGLSPNLPFIWPLDITPPLFNPYLERLQDTQEQRWSASRSLFEVIWRIIPLSDDELLANIPTILSNRRQEVDAAYEAILAPVYALYGATEVVSWSDNAAQAKEYLAWLDSQPTNDPEPSTPMLTSYLARSMESELTLESLAQRIVKYNGYWNPIRGDLNAQSSNFKRDLINIAEAEDARGLVEYRFIFQRPTDSEGRDLMDLLVQSSPRSGSTGY